MRRLVLLGLLALEGPRSSVALRRSASAGSLSSLEDPAPAAAGAAQDAGVEGGAKKAGPGPKRNASGLARPKTPSNWDLYATPGGKDRATMLIPKVLHQTYKSLTLPPRFMKYRETWSKFLPQDWARKLWTEEELRDLIKEHYPWFLETYDTYEQDINRIYAARIFLLHHFGGVYADLDVEAVRDPSPLFAGDYDLVFFYNRPPKFRRPWTIDRPIGNAMGVIGNNMMASVSKHPFWLFLAQRMVKSGKEASALREKLYTSGAWNSKFKDVMWTTGNSLLTDALAEYQEKFPETIAGVYSAKYWSPWRNEAKDDLCEGPESCSQLHPDAHTVHHWTGCWNHCTPGTCLPKAEDSVKKRKHKRFMPPPPPTEGAPAPVLQEVGAAAPAAPDTAPAAAAAAASPAAAEPAAASLEATKPAVAAPVAAPAAEPAAEAAGEAAVS